MESLPAPIKESSHPGPKHRVTPPSGKRVTLGPKEDIYYRHSFF